MHYRRGISAFLLALGLLATARAQAAALQKVTDWGASGVPATVSMYIYVPDALASQPPILVLSHFCSGTAAAVFGQAQTGGLIDAADEYGFIVVVPQTSKNCWDVGSTKSLTHDGGGDTQAIAQMVKYTLTKYQADADRVYATGDSSGGMMTQALLALYPEVFKAGSAFAGVPAGCWAVGNPDGSWSNQCADGQVAHTAQEWGDLARGMAPGYSGPRPRVQLFHGDADPTIKPPNFTEAIKQWTNVLGLSAAPTSTDSVTLGKHPATRQRWQNSCGYVVLDAFSSQGGDHGPSDAIFDASFVVPFLGLDQTIDPEVAKCGTGGAGGATSLGGSGGTSGLGDNGGEASGGVANSGGALATGGALPSSGAPATGGSPSSAGNPSLGGGMAAGGVVSGPAGSGGNEATTSRDAAGCSCAVVGGNHSVARLFVFALGAVLLFRKRR